MINDIIIAWGAEKLDGTMAFAIGVLADVTHNNVMEWASIILGRDSGMRHPGAYRHR
ncbi:hypothetical protein QO002_006310 [Pararhizobium capsulatum DSM 1112]|uniref:Uncharacterized protein n=1 Tax=Pararhizobium capsulatum DSM 1112 TaxID=1121113 RepID=A0ABU0C0P8_9HYPH|nr:hypothetical protein [Pararhizobium capsulatum]MDQ0324103.1 hypothetical protein [Pararhizobium capsulatum DSM 1112]